MQRAFLEELLKIIEDEANRKDIIQKIMDKHGEGVEENKLKVTDLTSQLESKGNELTEAQKLIADLKKSSKGNEELQAKFTDYESRVAQLEAENEQLKIDNEIKVELLAEKAKPSDLDYLMFKIKQEHTELSLDEQGKLKGINIADIKQVYPGNFETSSKKEVDVNDLPNIKKDVAVTKEQFDKMSYKEKNELFKNDPDTYKELSK